MSRSILDPEAALPKGVRPLGTRMVTQVIGKTVRDASSYIPLSSSSSEGSRIFQGEYVVAGTLCCRINVAPPLCCDLRIGAYSLTSTNVHFSTTYLPLQPADAPCIHSLYFNLPSTATSPQRQRPLRPLRRISATKIELLTNGAYITPLFMVKSNET